MLWVLIRIASYNICFYKNVSCGYSLENRLGEAILMSTHNICFYAEMLKIVPKLSPNTLLICATDYSVVKPHCSVFFFDNYSNVFKCQSFFTERRHGRAVRAFGCGAEGRRFQSHSGQKTGKLSLSTQQRMGT